MQDSFGKPDIKKFCHHTTCDSGCASVTVHDVRIHMLLVFTAPVPVSGTLLLLFMRPAVVRLGHVCLAHVVRHLVFPSWIVVGRVCH